MNPPFFIVKISIYVHIIAITGHLTNSVPASGHIGRAQGRQLYYSIWYGRLPVILLSAHRTKKRKTYTGFIGHWYPGRADYAENLEKILETLPLRIRILSYSRLMRV